MAKSLKAFREWAVKAGSVGNPSGGSYKGQCVSLVQQYLEQVFGIPYKARGNAKDFVPPTFKRLSASTKRLPGDIIRYGGNYGWGYGHIALIDDEGKFLDQNGSASLRVARRDSPFNGIESVWRPTKKFVIKESSAPASGRKSKNGTASVLASVLNVRTSPSTSAKIAATYKKGERFNYDSYIDANGYRWLSYISYSKERRYVAQASKDKKTKYVNGGV